MKRMLSFKIRQTVPGFTLLEMLLAVAVFAIVAVVASISLASTVRSQVANRQSHDITLQSQQLLQVISKDIENSVQATSAADSISHGIAIAGSAATDITLCTNGSNTKCYPQDGILVLNVYQRDSSGKPTPVQEKHVYCMSPVKNAAGTLLGKKLARYTLPADLSRVSVAVECTLTGIKTLYGVTSETVQEDFLTDDNWGGISLRFWPLGTESLPNPTDLLNPQGFRIEVTAKYDPRIGDPSSEARFNDNTGSAPQITVRETAIRNNAY